MKNYSSNMVSPEQFTVQIEEVSKEICTLSEICNELEQTNKQLKIMAHASLVTSLIAIGLVIGKLMALI